MKLSEQINKTYFYPLLLSAITFLRFYFADNSISYDYKFYILFIEELSELTWKELFKNIIASFPYVSWANCGSGSFEFLFAIFCYVLSLIFDAKITYAMLAAASIYAKMWVFFKIKANKFIIIIFYIYSVTIFESNAVRVGIALAFFMYFIYFYINFSKVYISLIIISISLHVSMIVPIFIFIASIFLLKRNKIFTYISIFVAIILFFEIEKLIPIMGEKIKEYYILSKEFDFYNKTSGLKITTILSFLFAIYFYKNFKLSAHITSFFGMYISLNSSIMIFTLTALPIIADRLWLIFLPLILFSMALQSVNKEFGFDSIKSLIYILLVIYVIGNLLYRYPSTNFFNPLTPHKVFWMPEAAFSDTVAKSFCKRP